MSETLYSRFLKSTITGNECSQHIFVIPNSYDLNKLFDINAWVNLWHIFRVHDEIIVYPENDSCRLHFVVLAVGRGWVKAHLISKIVFEENIQSEEEISVDYKVVQRGRKGWCVVRLLDGDIVAENLGDAKNAELKIKELMRFNGNATQSL